MEQDREHEAQDDDDVDVQLYAIKEMCIFYAAVDRATVFSLPLADESQVL